MLTQFAQRYLPQLDATLHRVVDAAPVEPGFNVMLRYPMGWVTADNTPYDQPTGKRIRPILLLLCSEAAGGNWHQALPAAAAVELVHNFSLIHDDIQDDSPTRHGRDTVWKVWGTANAINAGDALFSLAYSALALISENPTLKPDVGYEAWRIFNHTMLELTRGQHLDMRFEHQTAVTVAEYLSMIGGKSAALVATCAQLGALIATNDSQLARQYADYGYNLGIAFQIHDDILGIWGDPAVTGKSAATDILSRKKSLPVLYALAQDNALAEVYNRQTFGEGDVADAVQILNDVNALDYARGEETRYYDQALAALRQANPQGQAAEWLLQLTSFLFERAY